MLDRRLLFVSGKGGVGKSAVTAALATVAARRGRRVLVMGLVDHIGLASHFGVDHLSYRAQEIRPGLFALAVDRSSALDEYLRLQVPTPKAAPTGPITAALAAVVDTVPGVREIVSIGKPIYELWQDEWDLVIVDAVPLGQLISYLRAPITIRDLVPSGRVREQAARMRAALLDPSTSGLVLVVTPEELPVAETVQALDQLADEPVIDVAGITVNRVLPPLDSIDIAALPPGPHADAAMLHTQLVAEQASWLASLPRDVELPYLFGLHTPPEVAARLADEWEDQWTGEAP